MTDVKNEGDFDAEGNYILEDTGESLSDFDKAELNMADAAAADASARGELARLEEENSKLRDQYLRALAEFDNLRKRTEREKQDFYRYALADMVRDLLPVLDNFERALASTSGSTADFRTGVEMIYKQFSDVLSKNGVTVVGDEGVPFDPNMHEAVATQEATHLPDHTVSDVMQKGYFLNERLLRPAMVRVSVGGAPRQPDEGGRES